MFRRIHLKQCSGKLDAFNKRTVNKRFRRNQHILPRFSQSKICRHRRTQSATGAVGGIAGNLCQWRTQCKKFSLITNDVRHLIRNSGMTTFKQDIAVELLIKLQCRICKVIRSIELSLTDEFSFRDIGGDPESKRKKFSVPSRRKR